MTRIINKLFTTLEELRILLNKSIDKARQASEISEELSGEFDQEIGADMDTLQGKLDSILDSLNSSIEEGRTLWDDERVMEKSLRAGLDDEENYKTDSERIQEEIEEEKEKA